MATPLLDRMVEFLRSSALLETLPVDELRELAARVHRSRHDPGEVQHLVMSFCFAGKLEPPARYSISVEGPGGSPRLEAPWVCQPPVGRFPQTLCCALSFMIC